MVFVTLKIKSLKLRGSGVQPDLTPMVKTNDFEQLFMKKLKKT